MRRLFALTLLALITLSSGCVAVSAKNNRLGCECQVVTAGTGDRIFIVDTRTGAVREVLVRDAKPFEKDEVAIENEED